MARPHEGSKALLDIGGCGDIDHTNASFLEEFKMNGLASNERDGRVGADSMKLLAGVAMFKD